MANGNPNRIGIQTYESFEVDLWDHVFETRPKTKTVKRQVDELQKRLDQVQAAVQVSELEQRLAAMRTAAGDAPDDDVAAELGKLELLLAAMRDQAGDVTLGVDEADDEVVRLIGQMLDTRLAPADGKRTKASALIERKWDADELELDQLYALLESFAEADSPS